MAFSSLVKSLVGVGLLSAFTITFPIILCAKFPFVITIATADKYLFAFDL